MSGEKELRQLAVSLLARREYTHAELRKKLASNMGEAGVETIDAVLTELERRGLLSDERAAASYLRGNGAKFGTSRLRQSLRDRGLDDHIIAECLEGSELPNEFDRARIIWLRKFKVVPQDAREWAKQARFLQSRGFSFDVIRRLLKDQEELGSE